MKRLKPFFALLLVSLALGSFGCGDTCTITGLRAFALYSVQYTDKSMGTSHSDIIEANSVGQINVNDCQSVTSYSFISDWQG